MPTMSSSRVNPSCTPLTAFATRALVRPCRERNWRVSPSRVNETTPEATLHPIPGGSGLAIEAFPFSTTTLFPCTLTLTPAGTVMGARPIRDMRSSSPDVAHDLSAHARLAGILPAHQALGGREDGQADAAHHRGDLLVPGVDAPAGAADHREARDDRVAFRVVVQRDADHLE